MAKPESAAKEPALNGQPLSKIICNNKASASLTLNELLTLKRIITTNDPDIATFELPISYDVITNQRVYPVSLHLLVDGSAGGSNPLGVVQDCERGPNGDCLLVWNTDYDPPGQHALQAQIYYGWHSAEIKGPATLFFSSNICRFELFYGTFDPNGATLYAELPERNGSYLIELKSPLGSHIITLKGTTSNGVINVDWNLIDEQGRRYTRIPSTASSMSPSPIPVDHNPLEQL